MKDEKTTTKVARQRVKSEPVPIALVSGTERKRTPLLKQGTTWAGVFTVAAAIASGGVAAFLDPMMIAQIGAGVALLFAEN